MLSYPAHPSLGPVHSIVRPSRSDGRPGQVVSVVNSAPASPPQALTVRRGEVLVITHGSRPSPHGTSSLSAAAKRGRASRDAALRAAVEEEARRQRLDQELEAVECAIKRAGGGGAQPEPERKRSRTAALERPLSNLYLARIPPPPQMKSRGGGGPVDPSVKSSTFLT